MSKFFSILLIATFFSLQLDAQSFYAARRERSLIFSGGIGTSTYYGDLANPGAVIKAEPNINAGLQYFFSKRIAARVELNWFTLDGADAEATPGSGRGGRNLSFQSSNFELSTIGIVNLFSNGNRYYRRPQINIYGFAGIGVVYTNPKAKDPLTGDLVSLQPLQTEKVSYSLINLAIPFGLGIRFKLTPQINMAVEGGWRKLFTDYLDDVSTTYPGTAAFSDPLAARMSDKRANTTGSAGGKRGSATSEDAYMLLNVKLEYYLPVDFNSRGNGLRYSKKHKPYKYKRRKR